MDGPSQCEEARGHSHCGGDCRQRGGLEKLEGIGTMVETLDTARGLAKVGAIYTVVGLL
jgi:hypothetical protein